LEKFIKNLEKYKNEKLLQKKASIAFKNKKKSIASLSSIEKALKGIINFLDHYHQISLQKGIIQLRKLAKEKGLGNGTVITKEDFDYTIKPVLQPYITLNDTFIVEEEDGNNVNHQLKQQNLIAKEWKEKISKLFTLNNEETLKQVISNTQQDEIKNKKSFEKWNLEKSKVKHDREREDVSVVILRRYLFHFFLSLCVPLFLSFSPPLSPSLSDQSQLRKKRKKELMI
jgi:hypothetical protein